MATSIVPGTTRAPRVVADALVRHLISSNRRDAGWHARGKRDPRDRLALRDTVLLLDFP